MMERSPGRWSNAGARVPSVPGEGPKMREMFQLVLCCRPRTLATVFSWAPPTINRVMTCVTRIRRQDSGGIARKFLQPLQDLFAFVRIRNGVAHVELIVVDCRIGVLPLPCDFAKAVIDPEGIGINFFEQVVVIFCLVQFTRSQVGDG